jgi:hypothetical protein
MQLHRFWIEELGDGPTQSPIGRSSGNSSAQVPIQKTLWARTQLLLRLNGTRSS